MTDGSTCCRSSSARPRSSTSSTTSSCLPDRATGRVDCGAREARARRRRGGAGGRHGSHAPSRRRWRPPRRPPPPSSAGVVTRLVASRDALAAAQQAKSATPASDRGGPGRDPGRDRRARAAERAAGSPDPGRTGAILDAVGRPAPPVAVSSAGPSPALVTSGFFCMRGGRMQRGSTSCARRGRPCARRRRGR